MGRLAGSVERLSMLRIGRQAWDRSVDAIGRLWTDIRAEVERWTLSWEKVRLYQDGLPICGRETEIVDELATAGSPNHQILLSLMKKGAVLMGTESPELLQQEYRFVQRLLNVRDPAEAARIERKYQAESRALLLRRDQYIAERINTSLGGGETGILFLGLLHSVEPGIAKDIRITYPIGRAKRSGRREK